MIRFTGSIDGQSVLTFDRAFNRVIEAIDDFRFVWPTVAREFYAIEAQQFASEGATGASGKWAALSPSYKIYKEQHWPGELILQREHSLIASMTSMDAGDSIFLPAKDSLTIGSKTPYAVYHQRGGKDGKLPQREVISLSNLSKFRIQKEGIQRPLVRFVRAQGFKVTGDN